MTNWTPPEIQPLKRLKISEELLINKERWELAHNYHRQRQSYHYNALNHAGIVCGLGVKVIARGQAQASDSPSLAKYQDGRGIEIKPGMAVDGKGNIIIVPNAQFYRIRSHVNPKTSVIVYLVLKYRDPDDLEISDNGAKQRQHPEIVTEQFRIDERTIPPHADEVELCRILLQPESDTPLKLKTALDVFSPQANELDLTHRIQARSRSQSVVRIATTSEAQLDPSSDSNLQYLLQSVSSLYPQWSGASEIGKISFNPPNSQVINDYVAQLAPYNLLYLTNYQFQQLSQQSNNLDILKEYITNRGGVVLVEAKNDRNNIGEIAQIQEELKQAIRELEGKPFLVQSYQELQQELQDITQSLIDQESRIRQEVDQFAQRLNTTLKPLEELPDHHLWTKPFIFQALPTIKNQKIRIWIGGGLIFVIGEISTAWGLNHQLSLPRSTIRSAQELGVNILHFAWYRHYFMSLQRK